MKNWQMIGVSVLLCVSAAPASGQVPAYLVDTTLDELHAVDLTTGQTTFIASVANGGLSTAADLAWKADTSELWTIDLSGGAVGTIDVTNGTFTPLFQSALSGWQGMAWDPVTKLFFLANQDDNIHTLDPATGTFTLLGNSGHGLLTCLDVDALGNVIGIDFSTGLTVIIDKVTGAGVVSGPGTINGFQGCGVDQTTGLIYGSNTNDDSLYSIDMTTGTATFIGAHGPTITFAKGFDLAEPGCTQKKEYGNGCAGTGGFIPKLAMDGCPEPNANIVLNLTDGVGGGLSILIISLGQLTAPIGSGCDLLVGTPAISLFIPLGGGAGVGGAGGYSIPATIPATVPPVTIYLQGFVQDTVVPHGFTVSNGLQLSW